MLDNVRVPHVYFLAKYSQVDPETGDYIKPKNAKLAYGTMVSKSSTLIASVDRTRTHRILMCYIPLA